MLDTILLTEPLVLDKQMWWWGNGAANTKIKMDMSLPVFATAQQGLWITNTGNVTFKDLSLIQKNNSLVVPFLKNVGIVELRKHPDQRQCSHQNSQSKSGSIQI